MLLASARCERVDWGRADRLCIEILLRLNPKGREPALSGGDDHDIDRKLHGHLTALRAVGPLLAQRTGPSHQGSRRTWPIW